MEVREFLEYAIHETQELAYSFGLIDVEEGLSKSYDRIVSRIVECYRTGLLDGCEGAACRCDDVMVSDIYVLDEAGKFILDENGSRGNKKAYVTCQKGTEEYKRTIRILISEIKEIEKSLGLDFDTASSIWFHAYDLYRPVYWYFFARRSLDGDVSQIVDDILDPNRYGELYIALVPTPSLVKPFTDRKA